MGILADDHNRRKGSGRKCNTVKICIENASRGGDYDCPPPSEPVFHSSPLKDCCGGASSSRRNKGKTVRLYETRECQTDFRHREQWTSTKCVRSLTQTCQTEESFGRKKFADSNCQTVVGVTRDVKQCGFQTSICCSTSDRPCQTEICGQRVCHHREKRERKRNTSCKQPHYANYKSDISKGRGSPCEKKHVFPFLGETASGYLLVHPDMVSYEHEEFGVLVAKPGSLRTRVEKLGSDGGIVLSHIPHEDCESPGKLSGHPRVASPPENVPAFPLPLPPRPPPRQRHPRSPKESPSSSIQTNTNPFQSQSQQSSPRRLSKGDCKISCSPDPRNIPFSLRSRPCRNSKNLEKPKGDATRSPEDSKRIIAQPINESKTNSINKSEVAETSSARNESGLTNEWNYVNPMYDESVTKDIGIRDGFSKYYEDETTTGSEGGEEEEDGRSYKVVQKPSLEEYRENLRFWHQTKDIGSRRRLD